MSTPDQDAALVRDLLNEGVGVIHSDRIVGKDEANILYAQHDEALAALERLRELANRAMPALGAHVLAAGVTAKCPQCGNEPYATYYERQYGVAPEVAMARGWPLGHQWAICVFGHRWVPSLIQPALAPAGDNP